MMNKYEQEYLSAQIRAGKNGEALRLKKAREKERSEARRIELEAEKQSLLRDKNQFETELESGILKPEQRMKAKQLLQEVLKKLYQVNELLHQNTHTDFMFETQEKLL